MFGGPAWAFLALLICATAMPAVQAAGERKQEQKAAKQAATYAGSETCQACHEDIFKAFQKNPHRAVEKDARRKWEGKACESCHGPGSLHAESTDKKDIANPAGLAASEADRGCLGCHLNQPTHAGRVYGGHAKNQVSCASCHSIHRAAPESLVARKASTVNKKCAECHTPVWAEFQRPHKHRLPEGAMSCVDCHNPHGSFMPRSMQTVSANEPGCLKCHGDKRGPFAYEHAPVRFEGCTACHQPHGSANPRMLNRHEVRLTCLECHSNLPLVTPAASSGMGGVPPAFHDLRSPRYRNCTICHVKIHGSHVNRALLR
jgi:DmsE family decaheme c-type cytochrome